MIRVTLNAKNAAKELAKVKAANDKLRALARAERKDRPETTKQMLERIGEDVREMLFKLSQFQYEDKERRKRISEATKAGLEKARKRGVTLGGARRKSNVDVKKLLALSKKGKTQQEIAELLGISQPLVSQILKKRRQR